MTRDLGHFREDYDRAVLRRVDLADDPVIQFGRWWQEWMGEDRYDAAACVLATADAEGRPSARYVLCRQADADGFVVYTNLQSRKATDVAANPYAALVFGWLEVNRQVRVEGPVSVVDDAAADAYWAIRPRGSQLGAWASDQSEVVADRAELDQRMGEAAARFGADDSSGPVPRPPHWSGLRVAIERMEFWQGRTDRLHDRFEYRRSPEHPETWTINRLAP